MLITVRRPSSYWKMEYNLREVPRANYKDLADVKLPRAQPQMTESKLYPVEIVEEEEDQVKVHYIGYDSAYDEWKKKRSLRFWMTTSRD